MPYQILMLTDQDKVLGYYQQKYYLTRFFADRRARILAKHYRYRKFIVEATR